MTKTVKAIVFSWMRKHGRATTKEIAERTSRKLYSVQKAIDELVQSGDVMEYNGAYYVPVEEVLSNMHNKVAQYILLNGPCSLKEACSAVFDSDNTCGALQAIQRDRKDGMHRRLFVSDWVKSPHPKGRSMAIYTYGIGTDLKLEDSDFAAQRKKEAVRKKAADHFDEVMELIESEGAVSYAEIIDKLGLKEHQIEYMMRLHRCSVEEGKEGFLIARYEVNLGAYTSYWSWGLRDDATRAGAIDITDERDIDKQILAKKIEPTPSPLASQAKQLMRAWY